MKTHSQLKQLPLVVVEEEGTPLFGRNWLVHVELAWDILKCTYLHERTCTMHAFVAYCPQVQRSQTGAVGNPPALEALLKRSEIIFKQELGKMKDIKVKVRVWEDAKVKFFKPRPVRMP